VGVDSLRLESFVGADQDFSVSGDAWGSDGKVGVSGQVGRDGRLDFAVSGVLKSTAGLGRLTGYRLAADSLHILGEVSGTLATPSIQFDLEMPAAQIEEIPMQDFTVSGNWRSPGDGSVSLRVGALSWGKNRFSDVFFDATRSGPKTDFLFGSNANKGDRIYLWGQVEADGKMIRVTADSMHVQASQVSLYNQGPLNVTYDPARGFHIDRFELAGPAGRIVARDHPDFKSVIEVLLHDMDLRPWVFMAGRPDVVGVMDAELVFSGDLSDPLVFVEGHLRQVDAYGFHVPAVAGNFSYGDRRMLVDLVLEPDHGKPITVSGVVPVDSDEPLELFLKSGGLAMTLLDTFVTGSAQMDGDLAVELRVRGSRDSPTYQGKLTWDNGKISHPSSGRVYEPVFARVQMDQNQVRLDSLVIGGMDERLAVKGTVELDDGEPGSFELQMDFEHFQPVYWPELKAEFSGQLQMNGTPHRPRLSGDLLVQKADIRLGELMATPSSGWDQAPFVRALQMAITVRADQQVWVRDQTFNIEMTGDLDVTKDIEGFKVFGNMQSRRGNYFFQNRRLGVTRGEISFQGKSPIDPNLDIEAQTRVMARLGPSLSGASSDGGPEPVTVTVGVGGTLSHPIITLSSTPSVGQFDEVLSVLVVGATRDAIAVSSASDLVLSTLANRFGQRLGEDLKLDLVEVDVSEANISRIRVGKYLTPRLFVSYAQDMSSTGREVAIDFRLLPSITIEARQIDSGKEAQLIKQTRESIDVVWEREW
jgi:autotransporter translocation and assembly factor TamB